METLAQKLDPLIKKEAMEEAHAQHWLVCCVSRDFIFDTFCEWSELGQEFIRWRIFLFENNATSSRQYKQKEI